MYQMRRKYLYLAPSTPIARATQIAELTVCLMTFFRMGAGWISLLERA
jgi:hypothetical protein